MTFIDGGMEAEDWSEEAKKTRRHEESGVVIGHHDSHGLCFDVQHIDGVKSCYELHELIVVENVHRKTCPCEFGNPCSSNCTCANSFMSGGCQRCCKYGSEEQQANAARRLLEQENLLSLAIKTLEDITRLGGNLSDEALTSRTGPNDAVARGIMYTGARSIAQSFLKLRKENS